MSFDNRKTPEQRRKAEAERLFWGGHKIDPVRKAQMEAAAELRKQLYRLQEQIILIKEELEKYED